MNKVILFMAAFCLSFFSFQEISEALPRPNIRVRIRYDEARVLRIRYKKKKRRKRNYALHLFHNTEGAAFVSTAIFKAPRRRVRFIDTSKVSGEIKYKALLRSKSGAKRWSKTTSVFVEQLSPEDIDNEDPKYPTELPKLSEGNILCSDAVVQEMENQINFYRKQNGMSALIADFALVYSAIIHSNIMADTQNLTHNNWYDEIIAAGFKGPKVGQNIAKYIEDPEVLLNMFSKSDGHNANMLYASDTSIGIGCVVDANGQYWWTHNFGRL